MKHITKNRPQMVSITKLYFFCCERNFCFSVLPIEKVRSYCITLGITEVILTGFTSSMLYFSPGNKLQFFNTLQLSVLLPCIQQQIKGEQSDEIRHSSLINSKSHEVKSTNMHCILTTNINKCRGEKKTRRKGCQIFTSAPARRMWTQSGTNIVIFLEFFCAQTNLFWYEMKIKKMYTET